jgi:hypothetical protein
MAVEVAQHVPDRADWRIHDRALADLDLPGRFSASKPPWNTPLPTRSASGRSRSGGQSNSADHSMKLRSPSVIGVSLSVAI